MIHRRAALAGGFAALAGAAVAAPPPATLHSRGAWTGYEARLQARLADAGGGRFDAGAARGLLELTNRARAAADVAAVGWSEDLAGTARAHAADLAGRAYVEHLSPEGFDPTDRLGLVARRMIGSTSENIAFHQGAEPADAARLMALWRSSPGHWRNLLRDKHSHAGFGVARKGDRVYAVGLYARPDGVLPADLPFRPRDGAAVARATLGAGARIQLEPLDAEGRRLDLDEIAAAAPGIYQVLVQRRLDARTYSVLNGPIFVWRGG